MNPQTLKSLIAQTHLAAKGHYTGNIDGKWGPLSILAGDRWMKAERENVASRVLPEDRAVILQAKAGIGFLRTLAAQIYLADLGIYAGRIDGQWGPQSTSAAYAWAAVERPRESNASGTALTPYQVAESYIGTREIPGKNHCGIILGWYRRLQISIFDDETPWCSTFANQCAMEAGYERTGKLNARSWLDVGEEIEFSQARPGCDVLIFERGKSNWQGHVTFFAGRQPHLLSVLGLGGNQGNEVNIESFGTARLLGVRRLRSLDRLQGGSNKI